MKEVKELNLGLDLGTNSVGWALVDENNDIVRTHHHVDGKKQNYAFWGVRMFEEASTAADRRLYRSSRRRIERRRKRILCLQAELKDEIEKVDKNFFQRINDSFFKVEDKELHNHYTYFDDDYTDQKYFEEYPTIYHLRKHLMETDEKADIRMLYLAISHIIKFRGHFLNNTEDYNKKDYTHIINIFENINSILIDFQNAYEDDDDFFATINIKDEALFYETLTKELTSNDTIRDKTQHLLELFDVDKKTFVNEFIICLLLGKDVKVNKISFFKDENYEEKKLNIDSETIESDIEEVKNMMPDYADLIDMTLSIKEIADTFYLLKLLKDKDYLSAAMIEQYNKHNYQLREFKDFIRKYLPEKYNEIFRQVCIKKVSNGKVKEEAINSYARYVGMNDVSGKVSRFSKCSRNDFYDYIRKLLDLIKDEDAKYQIEEYKIQMDNNEFLLKQRTSLNTVIPMQFHLMELKRILDMQTKYYSFLSKEKDGYTAKDRIIAIFKYKLPYYVGPLGTGAKNGWVARNNDEKITPWNYKEIINLDETAKNFIQNMQNRCTYLKGPNDYCLPKKSLLYSEFNTLQYLNKIKIDDNYISIDLKNYIIDKVFKVNKKPKKADVAKCIVDYYQSTSPIEKNVNDLVSILPEINFDMSSYIFFKDIFKDDFDKNYDMIEQIINDITIFEDKHILERRLVNLYHLDDKKVKLIKGFNSTKYGRICKNFLTGIKGVNPISGELKFTIMDLLRETNFNLQEILFNHGYEFETAIDEYNDDNFNTTNYTYKEYVEDCVYTSPMMKRSIIQSYEIIIEIEKILKRPIDNFYIECTRTNKDKRKKQTGLSRYENIKKMYDECKKISAEQKGYGIDLNSLSNELKNYENNSSELLADKLYLYFTQLGRCMYTYQKIDLHELMYGDTYDIDHIYPQKVVKDDSLSNRVLVTKHANQTIKKDFFLYQVKKDLKLNYGFFKMLMENKLITKEKYRRLTENEVTEEQLSCFVNRQVVSTNQSVIGLIDLIKNYHNPTKKCNSRIIYSKAENISDFRKTYDFVKSRVANNFHHAHDAYLNAVLGKVIDEYYTKNVARYMKHQITTAEFMSKDYTLKPLTILSHDQYKYDKDGNRIYYYKKDEVLKLLNKNIKERHDINETTRTYQGNSMFSKVTILPAGSNSIPAKTSDKRADTSKYGGINSYAYNKYAIVEKVDKKNHIFYCLEAIPGVIKDNVQMDKYLKDLFKNDKKVLTYNVINPTILINTVIEYNSFSAIITGKSGDVYLLKNYKDRVFSYNAICIIKKIEKYLNVKAFKRPYKVENDQIVIFEETINRKNKYENIIITREDIDLVKNELIALYEKPIYNGYSPISNIKKLLNNNFTIIEIEDYVYLINQLLILLKTNERASADLTLIGGSKASGIITVGYTLKPTLRFVSYSVTGFYKKLIFEVPNEL